MATRSWGQSKLLTQKSWAIIKENRYLLAFPILGFLVSLVPLAVFWIPAGFFLLNNQNWVGIALAIVGVFANQIVISISSGGVGISPMMIAPNRPSSTCSAKANSSAPTRLAPMRCAATYGN